MQVTNVLSVHALVWTDIKIAAYFKNIIKYTENNFSTTDQFAIFVPMIPIINFF